MMDSTTVVVMLMILLVLLLIGVLVFARVLAHRESRRRSEKVAHPHRSRLADVPATPEPPGIDTP